jgi:2-dehydropantoate 2-reductase
MRDFARGRHYARAMQTLVIGAGGVGGYLAARLAQAGCDVTIAARGAHGDALRERGITISSAGGVTHVALPRVVASADELRERFALVLLAVKWSDLAAACDALPNVLDPYGVVLPLLNGLTSEDVVAQYVGAQRTIAGSAYMSAGILAPGAIYANGNTRLAIASYRAGQDADLERIAALFTAAQVPVQRHDDAAAMLWQKMVWNAPFNGICALARQSAGVCAEQLAPLVARAMREVIAVARAEGVSLPDQLVDAMLRVTRDEFALTEPSMLQDVRAGRPTEVEMLQGEVVARAERLGVDVPVLATLAGLIRALDGTRVSAP